MTRRGAAIKRRADSGPLSVFFEVPAAGYLRPWLFLSAMETRRFWEGIAHTHGAAIADKVRQAMPGCRAGVLYLSGRLPPLPLLEEPPEWHVAARQFVDVDGERLWWCGPSPDGRVWLPCQAEHLRGIGEVDGREWREYVRWRDEGYPARYQLSGGNRTTIALHHLCF